MANLQRNNSRLHFHCTGNEYDAILKGQREIYLRLAEAEPDVWELAAEDYSDIANGKEKPDMAVFWEYSKGGECGAIDTMEYEIEEIFFYAPGAKAGVDRINTRNKYRQERLVPEWGFCETNACIAVRLGQRLI